MKYLLKDYPEMLSKMLYCVTAMLDSVDPEEIDLKDALKKLISEIQDN